MEIRNITTFLRVAQCGSFTKAAEQLGYVQSTVTVQIQQLEQELGVPLFDRTGKQIVLTLPGQKLVSYAEQLLHITEQAGMLGKNSLELTGKLRIGVLESLFVWILSDCIPIFHRQYPRITLETKTATGTELMEQLKHGELDFVFLLDKKIAEKDCVRALDHPVEIVFITHPQNPLTRKTRLCLRDIISQPLILVERNSIYRQMLEEQAALQDIYITPFLEVDNTNIISRLISKGLGVSILPEYTVARDIAQGRLARLQVSDCFISLWSQIFYHKNKWLPPQMEGFINIIRQEYL